MSKILLVYADNTTGEAVERVVGKKGRVVRIESLSQLHVACRKVSADALFIGEEEWDVFRCTALHPQVAPYIQFPIIMTGIHPFNLPAKRQIIFRFVSIPKSQRSRAEVAGYHAVIRPFLRRFSPLFAGTGIKVLGPDEPLGKAKKGEKSENERQAEIARRLCGHRKCREIFDLILSRGEKGAAVDFIQLRVWPNSSKSRRSDIHSYVCKMRKSMREHPKCTSSIAYKDGKYLFVQQEDK